MRVWSRDGGSEGGCGPGLKYRNEGVVKGWRIKLRVWSRAGGSN